MAAINTVAYLADAANIHTQRWAGYFAALGWRVVVYSYSKANIPGVEVVLLSRNFGKCGYLLSVFQVRKMLRRLNPDVVHAHYASGYGFLGALTGIRPYIISVWGSDVYEFPERSWIHRRIFSFNMARADHICSTSKIMAEEISKYTDKEVTLTPFGIDCDEYSPKRKDNGFPTVVGTVKRLEPVYGVDNLIRAFSLLVSRRPDLSDTRLVIAGDGSIKKDLVRLTEQMGLSGNVSFIGKALQSQVPGILNSFSIYVALSLRESFGVAVLEASACGLPVVVSDVGGLPEVVSAGKTGFVVPSGDIPAAADAIERLIDSVELRDAMGTAGRDFVLSRYRWLDNAKIMKQLYDNCLNG